jgi:hypothetical protein
LNRGFLDLGQLRVVSLEAHSWKPENVDSWISEALRRPSWIIFFTHEINESPTEHGSTPAMLNHVLSRCRKAKLDVMTVKNALALSCFGESA